MAKKKAARVRKKQGGFHKLVFKSRGDFVKEYEKRDQSSAKDFYLQVLSELEHSVASGNKTNLKYLSNTVKHISDVENQTTLNNFYKDASNPLQNTNLIILACKYNQPEILKYLLDNGMILTKLSIHKGSKFLLCDDDESSHNAFYYAIRSGNIELFKFLISLAETFFITSSDALDEILSKAYEELKLKNVTLTSKMEFSVENKLLNLRFISDNFKQYQNITSKLDNIKKRIDLVIENMNLLATHSDADVDEIFLFNVRFIAQNIHVLKRQLKFSYDRLPWEEMEFCLICFVSSYTKQQEINLFYHATLNKRKIQQYLKIFAKKLEEVKEVIAENIDKLTSIPALNRETVIAKIMKSNPQFDEMYKNYQQIRDIYSLEKIGSYINLVSTVNPGDREGQLVITRVLQIIGEYLKNTLESPKLSSLTSDLLLLKFSKNTRKVLTDLRNLLSHALSLFKRAEIEENSDIKFYIGVQSDLKKVGETIIDMLYDRKIEMIKILLSKIIDCENVDDITEVVKALKNVEEDNKISHDFRMLKHEMFGKMEAFLEDIRTHEMVSVNFRTMEHEKLKKIVNELKSFITDMTDLEKSLFTKIDDIIDFANSKFRNIRDDYLGRFYFLKHFQQSLNDINNVDNNTVREMKYAAKQILKNMSSQIEPHGLKEISELSEEIFRSFKSRHSNVKVDDKVNTLFFELFCVSEFQKGNIKWIEEFRGRLNKKSSVSIRNRSIDENSTHLKLKLCELKIFLSNVSAEKSFFYFKDDKKLQIVIEMLLLDIMSILSVSKCYIVDDLFYFDGNYPLLIGKCLRNHLAHDNALFDILLSNSSSAIFLNASIFIDNDIIKFLSELQERKKKIGKMMTDNPLKLKKKHEEVLEIIENQRKMYASLEEGNLELIQECIKKGADINARSINSWTALHHAAKGPSLEVLKFILESNIQVDVDDQNGQNPLHIAATHGNANIVQYLIETTGLSVNKEDKNLKTPLHMAAEKGHEDTVKVLLKFNADNIAKDMNGVSPLYYAIRNNHFFVAKILLRTNISSDINSIGSCMPLHEAAELGHLEIVNLLLQNRADVNAKKDANMTPLHVAARMGHLEITKALIIEGADVNAIASNGCTPLHYALVNGHEEIANLLLCHEAEVNISNKICKYTSLHYAAEYGYKNIVKTLLKHRASATVKTIKGATPLHLAAQNGRLGIIIDFLKQDIDIDIGDSHNATPLHYAAGSGQEKAAELLIENGAAIDVKDDKDFTPLYVAVLKGYKDVVNMLINKANVNAQDIEENTILHAATLNGYKDVIELLIKHKTDINARNNSGFTPLHLASEKGYEDVVLLLIKNKADVNTENSDGLTPLHTTIIRGHKNILELLIKNNAEINVRTFSGQTSLHLAIKAGHKEIAEILILNGVDVNEMCGDYYTTPLLTAVKYNHREIVKILLDKGAVIHDTNDQPLLLAVIADYKDIVEILIKHKGRVDIDYDDNYTLLHFAANRGHIDIVKMLMEMGADLNAKNIVDNVRPLHFAVQHDHEEVVEYLIANGADINAMRNQGTTALHIAAASGHSSVMKVLLDNKADVTLKDYKNRTPIELAVENGHLQVTKMLLQNKMLDINAQYNEGQTLLHIAAQGNNLNLVRYLINEGADIEQTDVEDSMPIHFAAMGGVKDTVEYLLSNGCSINDLGAYKQTLLHYALMRNTLEIATCLIDKGADVNAKDERGLTPIRIAVYYGFMDGIELLLRNGAAYDISDNLGRKPWHLENSETAKNAINYLKSTNNFFKAVKRNNLSDIEKYIDEGVFVDVKNSHDVTPLLFAVGKGHEEVVSILLQNNASPNTVNYKGITPLHYASKHSHLKVVKALLSYGAVFDAVSNKGNTPLDFSTEKDIHNLLKLIGDSFISVTKDSSRVIHDLNKIKDIDTMKAIMNACNKDGETLIVAAILCDFRKVGQLKNILQDDAPDSVNRALKLTKYGDYQSALCILNRVYEKRKSILGPNNPGTLEIEHRVAVTLHELGNYKQALDKLEGIYQKQKTTLGSKCKETLKTRSTLALLLYRQDRNEEALEIFQEVYQMQKEIIGPNQPEVLDTQFHMALVLAALGQHEEALKLKINH